MGSVTTLHTTTLHTTALLRRGCPRRHRSPTSQRDGSNKRKQENKVLLVDDPQALQRSAAFCNNQNKPLTRTNQRLEKSPHKPGIVPTAAKRQSEMAKTKQAIQQFIPNGFHLANDFLAIDLAARPRLARALDTCRGRGRIGNPIPRDRKINGLAEFDFGSFEQPGIACVWDGGSRSPKVWQREPRVALEFLGVLNNDNGARNSRSDETGSSDGATN